MFYTFPYYWMVCLCNALVSVALLVLLFIYYTFEMIPLCYCVAPLRHKYLWTVKWWIHWAFLYPTALPFWESLNDWILLNMSASLFSLKNIMHVCAPNWYVRDFLWENFVICWECWNMYVVCGLRANKRRTSDQFLSLNLIFSFFFSIWIYLSESFEFFSDFIYYYYLFIYYFYYSNIIIYPIYFLLKLH